MNTDADAGVPPDRTPIPVAPLELTYAPPAKSRNRAVWVIMAGLFTTACSLAGVYYLQVKGDTNVMGWYANYIIPGGAIVVGMAASSGYALVSWMLGVKIRRQLLMIILALLLASYFAAEYVAFKSRGPLGVPTGTRQVQTAGGTATVKLYRPIGFWEYFHLRAVNWTWKKQHSYEKESEPLGMAGYFFVLLAMVGFAFSGLIIPAAVGKKAYCDLCERYMATRQLAMWPAIDSGKKVSKKDVEGQARKSQENQMMIDQASARLEQTVAHAQAGDVEAFRRETSQTAKERKAAGKLLRRLEVNLVRCKSCSSGWLQPAWLVGQGKQLKRVVLPKVELAQEFIRAFEER